MSEHFSPLALDWTAMFLTYPPRFLGVNGMRMTEQRLKAGIPTTNRVWIEQAVELDQAGFTPEMYKIAMLRLEVVTQTRPFEPEFFAWLYSTATPSNPSNLEA